MRRFLKGKVVWVMLKELLGEWKRTVKDKNELVDCDHIKIYYVWTYFWKFLQDQIYLVGR